MGHAKDTSGIWGHSSSIGADSYFIFAVGDSLISDKAFMGWCASQGIGMKPLLGCYKGKTEHSYIMNCKNLGTMFKSGWLQGQETILLLGPCDSRDRRGATLAYLNKEGDGYLPESMTANKTENLGVLQSVDRDTALASVAWSYDPSTKDYFICVDPIKVKLCPIGLEAAILVHMAQHEKPMGYDQNTADLIRTYLLARRTI